MTVAATLVPPVPNPVLSLTCKVVGVSEDASSGCSGDMDTDHGDKLGRGWKLELEAGAGRVTRKLLVDYCACLDIIRKGRWTVWDEEDAVGWRPRTRDAQRQVGALFGLAGECEREARSEGR